MDNNFKSMCRFPCCSSSFFAPDDVLEMSAVPLHATEAKPRALLDAVYNGNGLRWPNHPCSPESYVDVAQHRQMNARCLKGSRQFVDTMEMVDHRNQVAVLGQ